MIGSEPRYDRIAILLGFLIVLRTIAAATLPLAFDEAYYWLWSRQLAAGYYDHPPMIAFVIRAGTAIFGDSVFGVRAGVLLLSVAATWAVWRSTAIVTGHESTGGMAAILFNLTLMVSVQALVATPDAPAMCAAAFFMLALAKVSQTGEGRWWLAAGVAAGFALLSKYTAPFLGLGALLWLITSRKERHWLASPWPYVGAGIALLMFTPNLLWNADNGWAPILRQFGRTAADAPFTLRFLGEFLGAQIALATPFLAVLMVAGAGRVLASRNLSQSPQGLIAALVVPATLYFLWHSLRGRVQGNWPSFLYPMLAVAAALAWTPQGHGQSPWLVRVARLLAVPVALVMTLFVYVQALTGIVPIPRDPLARLLAVGYAPVASEVEALRLREGAGAVLTTSYAQTGWLSFYLPVKSPVIQFNERERWTAWDAPDVAGPLLYVTEEWRDLHTDLSARFDSIAPIARITRSWHGRIVEIYVVYRISGAPGPLFGH